MKFQRKLNERKTAFTVDVLGALLLCLAAPALVTQNAAIAKTPEKPLATIAPDLIVEALEFGKFPDGKSPFEVSADKVKFIPVPSGIANEGGCEYGFRLKVKTKSKAIRLYKTFNTPKPREPKKGDGYTVSPVNGAIYECWHLDGFKNGDYWVKVWLEDKELPKLAYKLKF